MYSIKDKSKKQLIFPKIVEEADISIKESYIIIKDIRNLFRLEKTTIMNKINIDVRVFIGIRIRLLSVNTN